MAFLLALARRLFLVAATAAAFCWASPTNAAPVPPANKPKVEVVFCLDTTGSMGGLIESAKQKIWAICNQIAGGKPTPALKVGLVAYRDRGDAYITKVFDLTDDLDAIYGHLKGFQAQGGGDGPESVNQALDDAVHKIKWDGNKATLRIIFLVGDAPPHMDYKDDIKYPETCKKACVRGIIVNTIQCGADNSCQHVWKDVAVKSEGAYVQIAQDGAATPVVATPFDKRLGEINDELARSTLLFGVDVSGPGGRAADAKIAAATLSLAASPKAERAGFNAKNGIVAAYDLIDNIKQNKVKLEDLKKDQLPQPLKGKTLEEQKQFLAGLDKKRTALNGEALALDKKRAEFIAKKRAETANQAAGAKAKSTFDGEVLDVLRKQATKNGIAY